MIQIFPDTEYIYLRLDDYQEGQKLYMLAKHNTNKPIYKIELTPEKERTFYRFSAPVFPDDAPYGEYSYYITPDDIDINDIPFYILDTLVEIANYILNKGLFLVNKGLYIINGESCIREIKILNKGLLMRRNEKVNYKTYGEKRQYTEHDKTR